MTTILVAYQPLIDQIVIACLLALSQYVVLRAGIFSLASASLACIAAYVAAILTVTYGLHPGLAFMAAVAAGCLCALVLSVAIARIRGVFQAIATLAFAQVVIALALWDERLTGGAMGFNGIPKTAQTLHLVIVLAVAVYIVHAVGRSSFGRAFDTMRQDETVAVSLGISVSFHISLAFAISGALAGAAGSLVALNSFSLVPEQFGFALLVSTLASVVIGGRIAVAGPLVGALVLTLIPEFSRQFQDYRMFVYGLILLLSMIYLPEGIADTIRHKLRIRRETALRDGARAGEVR